MLPVVLVIRGAGAQLLFRYFKKRPHYVLLSLDFTSLGAQFGAILLEISVSLLAYADGCPIFAFHLPFIHLITDKDVLPKVLEMNHVGDQHTARR
jgi:hypothetical protein